jgi:DNA (cytosine-5)-methyltransferase 1
LSNQIRFIDLFAGIGGFHIAFHNLGAECVFASEINPHARTTYEHNIKKISPQLFEDGLFNDDILKIIEPRNQVPDFDVLCAGFPCQPFSQAGFKRGFSENLDSRGNMFFRICDILKAKRPKAFFLENVRHLIKHDDGKTFKTIQRILEEELNYTFHYKVVKASEFGLPQHRPRVFIVGFNKDYSDDLPEFKFPEPIPLKMTMSDIWGGECPREIGYTLRVGGRGSGLNDRRNWDSYLVDGKERRLSHIEGRKMMGLPEDFEFPVSNTQALKQLGNSVAVNAIEATARSLLEYLNNMKIQKPQEKMKSYA